MNIGRLVKILLWIILRLKDIMPKKSTAQLQKVENLV